ncbi:DUF349 domain-containing protein [Salana multivorans]|uniref:DUF349 domain-containing protein n=1 Tax=Salana multivorans TaxID=120377 RepID=UPI000A77E111|nr:DUF349 domain-containing protein [Salana multivorans]
MTTSEQPTQGPDETTTEQVEVSGDEVAEVTPEAVDTAEEIAETAEETVDTAAEPVTQTPTLAEAASAVEADVADVVEQTAPVEDVVEDVAAEAALEAHDVPAEEPAAEPAAAPEAEDAEPAAAEPDVVEPVEDAPVAAEAAAAEPTEPETAAAEEPADQPAATPSAPRPAPRPGPRPGARPGPRPQGAPRPVAAAPAPVAPPVDAADAAAAAEFGSVAEDGTVSVRDGEEVRVVGQVTVGEEPLALYIRRYLDLKAQVALLEARLPSISPKEAQASIASLTDQLTEPAAVGDLPALRERVAALTTQVEARAAEVAAEREAAKAQAVAEREAIVAEVEAIAATDPERTQWRDATTRLAELLDTWKKAQREGVRIDRPVEEALWKRFSHARTAFDKARRAHFGALDKRNQAARSAKEELVAQAEALAGSTDWGPTSSRFRELMDAWRAAPRGARKDDDALWARFKGAQDRFFTARKEENAAIDAEYEGNLAVKLELLTRAEALLPISDLAATKRQLRAIQDAWDEAGRVPRADIQRVEGRLRAVEQAVRDAEQAEMKRSDPELRARADGMTAQLLDQIAELESRIAAASSPGQAKALEQELATKRQWLDVVKGTQR